MPTLSTLDARHDNDAFPIGGYYCTVLANTLLEFFTLLARGCANRWRWLAPMGILRFWLI